MCPFRKVCWFGICGVLLQGWRFAPRLRVRRSRKIILCIGAVFDTLILDIRWIDYLARLQIYQSIFDRTYCRSTGLHISRASIPSSTVLRASLCESSVLLFPIKALLDDSKESFFRTRDCVQDQRRREPIADLIKRTVQSRSYLAV